MLKLNTDEPRSLSFEVNIQGIDYKQLQGSIRFIVNEVEYGFPVKILGDAISAKVPPLDDVIKVGMKDGSIVECKLDIFGNGFYLQPWSGKFQLQTPVKMEAKMRVDEDAPSSYIPEPFDKVAAEAEIAQKLTVTLKNNVDESEDTAYEGDVEKEETAVGEHSALLDDDEVKGMLSKILENQTVLAKKVKKIEKTPSKKVSESMPPSPMKQVKERKKKLVEVVSSDGTKYLVSEKVAKKIQEASGVLKTKSSLSKPSAPKKREKILVNNDPRRLMESVGMKGKKIQDIMLTKAEDMAGDDPKAQCEALKTLLGIDVDKTQMSEMEMLHKQVMKNMEKNQ
ncbi:hypothetical protein KAR91_66320 [Candidatus Pacearchaeota archaeon]|nr:hypothetical protein [Candidatus Pacearchaeota archaeon]